MITVSGELGELRDLHPEVSDFFAALRRANPGIVDRQGLRLVRELRWLSDHYALIQQCGAFAVRHVHDAAFCGRGEMFKGWGELLRPAAEELEHDGSLALVAHFMIGPKAHDPNDLMLASAATEMVMWAMRFHQYGRPVIALQPGQAATLAMTDTARAMSADIRAPWPAFEITLPADEVRVLLGETFTSAGRVEVAGEHNLRRIWVSAYQGEPVPPAAQVAQPDEQLPPHAPPSGRSCGNRMTSRMVGAPVSSMTRRSMPMPSPAVGGRPYSSARM